MNWNNLPSCDDLRIWDVFLSANHYLALIAAVELGLFEVLAQGPKNSLELEAALNLNRRPVEILTTLMSALGFISREGANWCNTNVSMAYLIRDSPFFWGGMFAHDRDLPITGGGIVAALQNDQPTTPHGGSLWNSNSQRPRQAAAFTAAMHSHTFAEAVQAANIIDLRDARRLLDVAGGSGCFAASVAAKYPQLSVTVAEIPEITQITRSYLSALGMSDRVNVVSLDMFAEKWPLGFDAVLLSNVLHDWNDADCFTILKNASDALPPGGVLYLFEILLNDSATGPLPAASFSMTMMRLTHGRQRSAEEFGKLCASSGFSSFSIEGTAGYHSICKASK